jgi:hypothetical protein
MRNLRLTMLGILCAGLLLGGIGAGVTFAEYSSFTYAGEQLMAEAESRSQSFTLNLRPAGPTVLDGYLYGSALSLQEMARLEVREDVAPGTLCWDMRYETAGPTAAVSSSLHDGTQYLYLTWNHFSDLQLLLACKDQALSDIRSHRLGRYVPVQLTEVVIGVNPVDADRVSLS